MNLVKKFSFSKINIIVLCLNFAIFLSSISISHAQTIMSNEQYEIHLGTLNSFSGKSSNPNYKLSENSGQLTAKSFSGSNYNISSGLTSNSNKPFKFSISSLFIDFGPITSGSPVTRTNIMSISAGSSRGYSVLSYQNHPLKDSKNEQIVPDTTCDDGDCNEKTASKWSNVLTFGFGYRCENIEGKDCMSEFSEDSYFKQFPSSEFKENAQPVMRSRLYDAKAESEITYKLNISASQPTGIYENTITFLALPSL